MDLSVTFDATAKLRIQTLSGVATGEALQKAVKEVHRHPEFDPSYSYIWDFRKCRLGNVSSEMVREFADYLVGVWREIGSLPKGAVVVSRDLEYGMVRQFASNVPDEGELLICRDKDEAMAWVMSDTDE